MSCNWRSAPSRQDLEVGAVHVWRIPIDPAVRPQRYWNVLSSAEQTRALRFQCPAHQAAYVFAHGAMRTILAGYAQLPPTELAFETAPFGKPALAGPQSGTRLEFNLSHSGSLALLAVARDRVVGVDVVQWNADVDYTAVAGRYFSQAECDALRTLSAPEEVAEGFFSAWSRKEAYLKATGYGVSRGLDHFDVSLVPGEPAALLADRKDVNAPSRWAMVALAPAPGYSAALVVATPAAEILLFDAPTCGAA